MAEKKIPAQAVGTDESPTLVDSATKTRQSVDVPKGKRAGLEASPAVAGAEQVQAARDAEEDRGYWGTVPDPTPNEVYALPNPSLEPSPAPEVDADVEAAVHERLRRLGSTHAHRRPEDAR